MWHYYTFQYLSEHPNVFACEPKEPHYFATDIPGMPTINTEKTHFDLFRAIFTNNAQINDNIQPKYLVNLCAVISQTALKMLQNNI
jgi:hypothetical protein